MMSKKSPQLRFEGFTDDWEERKLGDVGDTFTGLTGKTKEDFGHGSAKFVTYVNVFQNPIATLDQLDAVEIDEKQNQVQKGDVFFTTSSETPEEVGMSSVWTYDTKNVYLNSFTFGYRPRVSFDLNYMASMLRSPSIRKKITFLAQGISRYNISKTKMLEIEIPAPNLSEQKKIGSFFKLLDDTIALHQRKLDLLKEQKKGYLQKMFPKNGAKVPELRFAGFADDWEERKLEDYSENTFGGGTPKTGIDEYWTGDIPWIQSSDLKKEQLYNVQPSKFITDDAVKNSATKLVPKNSIAIVTRVGVGKLALLPFEYATSQDFLSLSNLKVDKWFGIYSTYTMLQKELNNIQGTSIKGITKPELLKKKMRTPSLIDEQSKIGTLFKQLDDIIALHQSKLDLLKEQKKGFLQKMFPKNGAKVPELRFAGFADDWEDCKLEEVLRERNNQQSQSLENPLVSFTVEKGVTPKTDRYEREQLVVGDKSSKKYKVTVLNDIVYNPANLKFGAISRNKYGNAVFSPIYITFVVNNDVTTPEFIEMFVTRNDFIKRALKYQQGTVYERQSVSPADLLSMVLYLPGKAEQEKIGSFFKQLDDTIDLHQRKLDLLKEQKKGFLQKMFV